MRTRREKDLNSTRDQTGERRRQYQTSETLSGRNRLCQTGDRRSSQALTDSPLFRNSPISIWIEDFSEVKVHFESLRKKGVRDFRYHFEAHPEEVISLVGKIRIIDVNEATLRLYEAENRESLLSGLNIIFDKQSYNIFREELIALAEGRTEFNGEAENCTLLGKGLKILFHLTVPPGCEDNLEQVFVQVIDITAISRREDEVSRAEEKYRKIFQYGYEAVLLASIETGIILDANEAAGRVLGMPAGQMVGMHFTEFHPREEAVNYRLLFEKHATSGRFVSENLCVLNRDGRRIPVSMSSSIIEIQGKRYIAGIMRELPKTTPATDSSRTNQQSNHLTPSTAGGVPERRKIIERRRISPAADSSGTNELISHLTPREREIVCHIARGGTGRNIAGMLSISEKTVETHRARIMKKLSLHCTADLVRYAIKAKLV